MNIGNSGSCCYMKYIIVRAGLIGLLIATMSAQDNCKWKT